MIEEPGFKPQITAVQPEASGSNAPPPDEVIARVVNVLGGAATIGKIKTREEKGTVTIAGRNLPIEILSGSGGRQLTIVHLPAGDSETAYDRTSGWTSAPNRPVHAIPAVEVSSARIEADLHLALDMKQLFGELKSLPSENIGGHETYIVAGLNSGEIAAKFYIDKVSGYLVRMVRYTKTPLGQNPTQLDYADYREQDGVKVPFQVTVSRPNSRLAIQIDEVKFNIAIDDSRFTPPASAPVASPPAP
jgi:hypothetical protein